MEEIINDNFKGKIWNTTFGSNYCVLEIRDESLRQVSFACINLFDGNILWENLRPEKSWWLSLVGIFDEYLILHKYASNQKPEPEGLLILNVKSGEMVKRIDNWIFFNFYENILTIYQLQNNEPIYEMIDLSTLNLKKIATTADYSNHLTSEPSPTHYPEDSSHFPTIYKFLYRLLNIDAVKAVDYLEISNKIIISYYIYRDKSFQNYLLVTNRAREILLNELIAETEGIGIDTFTVKSDTLLYVKNQTQFVGYRL
jgi:hypothetical protein